jgi:DNA repair ATPase RecN
MAEIARSLSSIRKKRGVVRRSITYLESRVGDLEASTDLPGTPAHAEQLSKKLAHLDSEFQSFHLQLVELIEDEEDLEREQTNLDQHDHRISDLQLRLKRLCSPPVVNASLVTSPERNLISRKLS